MVLTVSSAVSDIQSKITAYESVLSCGIHSVDEFFRLF